VFGLVFSVAVMGVAANLVARLIDRYRWIAWLGLAVILWVACTMLYDGFVDPKIGLLRLVGVAVDAPSLPRP
jgi:predicted tellurium resistance membrane protein TerC